MKNNSLLNLPSELLLKILEHWYKSVHYDIKALFRLMPVCKVFYSYLSTNRFLLTNVEGAGIFPTHHHYDVLMSTQPLLPSSGTAYSRLNEMNDIERNKYLRILHHYQYQYLTPKETRTKHETTLLNAQAMNDEMDANQDHNLDEQTMIDEINANQDQNLAFARLKAYGGFLEDHEFAQDNPLLVRVAVETGIEISATRNSFNFNEAPNSLKYADPMLQNDKRTVIHAVQHSGSSLKFAPNFQSAKDVVLAAVGNDGNAIEFADPKFLNDRDVAIIAAQNSRYDYYQSPQHHVLRLFDAFSQDRELIRLAAIKNPTALHYASPELKKDKELVEELISYWGEAIIYADVSLQTNSDLALKALKRCCVQYFNISSIGAPIIKELLHPHLLRDINFLKQAMQIKADFLEYLEAETLTEFWNNREFLLIALRCYGQYIEYVPKDILDKELCIAAIESCPYAYFHIPDALKSDIDFLKVYLAQVNKMTYASFACRYIPEFLLKKPESFYMNVAYSAQAQVSWNDLRANRLEHGITLCQVEAPLKVFTPPMVLFDESEDFPTLREIAAQTIVKQVIHKKTEVVHAGVLKKILHEVYPESSLNLMIKDRLRTHLMGSNNPDIELRKICNGAVCDIIEINPQLNIHNEESLKLIEKIVNLSSKLLNRLLPIFKNTPRLQQLFFQQIEKVVTFKAALSMQTIHEPLKVEAFLNIVGEHTPGNTQNIALKYRQLRDRLVLESEEVDWSEPKVDWQSD